MTTAEKIADLDNQAKRSEEKIQKYKDGINEEKEKIARLTLKKEELNKLEIEGLIKEHNISYGELKDILLNIKKNNREGEQ